jgi:N-acetyl-anhydromuramyl-L-alanine amidase AmpD
MPKHSYRLSPNRSSRNGVPVDTAVIHTTEGSYGSAINWFSNPSSKASAHEVIDTDGDYTSMVPWDQAAWTSGGGPFPNMNQRSVNLELAGFASQTNRFWRHLRRPQLHTAAMLVAKASIRYGFPITRGRLLVFGPGETVGHVHVSGAGGHHDPGEGFPWKTFLLLCRLYRLRQLGIRKDLQERWRTIVMGWLRR